MAGTGQAAVAPGEPDYLIRSWNANDGLRDTTIIDIRQTKDGYLWFSTFGGIGRFDGMRFRFFDRDTTPIFGTRAMGALLADSQGRLWLSNGRSELLRHEKGEFWPVPLPEVGPGKPQHLMALEEFADGTLWLVTDGGRTHAWKDGELRIDEGVRLGIPPGAVARSDGPPATRWFWMPATNSPGKRFHGHVVAGRFQPVTAVDGVTPLRPVAYSSRRAGGRWLLTREAEALKLRALLPDGSISAGTGLPGVLGDEVSSFAEDAEGAFWLGTRKGVARVAPGGGLRFFTTAEGLVNNTVRAVFVDAEENVWAGTEGGGVSRLSRQVFQTAGRELGIVHSVLAADRKLWLGTHGQAVWAGVPGEFAKVPGADAFVLALHRDATGGLWVGEMLAGLHHLHEGTVRALPVGAPIRAVVDDGAGGVWAGGRGLYHVRNGVAQTEPGWTGAAEITSLCRDHQGGLWIGAAGDGLYEWREGRLKQFTRREGLAHDEVTALYADAGDALWIGSNGGGLCRLKDGIFKVIPQEAGLWDRTVCGIQEDGLGYFWFSSSAGIFRISRQDLEGFCDGRQATVHSIAYNQNDGLASMGTVSGSQPKITRDEAGRLWFATMEGVASVDPARLPATPAPVPVVVQEVTADGIQQPEAGPGGWGTGHELVFGPGLRRLEINYISPGLRAPEKTRYRYRLEGRDDHWTEAGPARTVAFDLLRPGSYRFQALAANGDQVWSPAGRGLGFVVRPYYWQTGWFRALAATTALAAVAGIVWLVTRQRYQRRLAELERQRAVDAERARIARDMHDDVGASLTRITMLGARVRQDLAEPARAASHLQQLREVSREMAGKLDELVWVVNPRNDNAAGLAEYLSHYAEQFFRAAQIPCRFDIPPGLPCAPLAAEARHEVFLAFKEALNNVVKHAAATEARFTVGMEPGIMVLVIEDNGRGFDLVTMAASGDGLRNLRERLTALGGACLIESQPGRGTRVTLRIPVVSAGASPG